MGPFILCLSLVKLFVSILKFGHKITTSIHSDNLLSVLNIGILIFDYWKLNIGKLIFFFILLREIKAWKRTYSMVIWILHFHLEIKRNPVNLMSVSLGLICAVIFISFFISRQHFTGYGCWPHSENIMKIVTECVGLGKPYQLFITDVCGY